MRARRRAWVVEDRQLILVKPYLAAQRLRAAGLKPLHIARVRAWAIDRKHLADVFALLERDGFNVIVNVPESGDAA